MDRTKNLLRKVLGKKLCYLPYKNREERAKFIATFFRDYIKDSVLDVGCGDALLKKYIDKNVKYIGVDISGNPDYLINLETDKLSLFKNNSFHTVICTEVLEHLEEIHTVFDDLCRVTRKYLIVSLPNTWSRFKFLLLKGKGNLKYYGLPIEKPLDRHKWFLNFEEALLFVRERGKKHNLKVKFYFGVPIYENTIHHHLFNLFFKIYYRNKVNYQNLFYSNIWILCEKNY